MKRYGKQKACETVGDAIVNYESAIVSTMGLMGDGGTSFPIVYTLQRQDARFVSNRTFYNLQITQRLSREAVIRKDDREYGMRWAFCKPDGMSLLRSLARDTSPKGVVERGP